jgi:serine/threonine-protein kinase
VRHPLESPALWARLEPVLDAVLELDGEARVAFMARVQRESPDLHAAMCEVLSRDPLLFAGTALEFAAPLLPPAAGSVTLTPGTQVGPYRLTRAIGQGGMGTVYYAERADGQFDMPVALKVVRADGSAHDDVAQRFLGERQTLARLVHPNIARLLDGGVTADGRPYFAMEYVDGRPLAEHAAHHGLSLTGRLELFLQVCAAVQYAHEHLVIHRDLKPTNVLVTAEGTVKLLDFGVAKVLGADADGGSDGATAPALSSTSNPVTMLVTPAYASPEQLRGEPVSTASDVYSLGVVLYELLTGRRPVELGRVPPHRWVETLAREDVPPASRAATNGVAIPADLDAILATALRYAPDGRYRTVDAFASDLQRFLAHEPVQARPATFGYKLSRFWGRHRAALTLAAAALVVLASFTAVTVVQSRRIRREAAAAVVERDRAQRVNDFLVGLFGTMYPYGTTGGVPTPSRMLDTAVARIERDFTDAPADASRLLAEIASAYMGVGDFAGAVRAAQRGIALEAGRAQPDSVKLAAQLLTLGLMRTYSGGGRDGEEELRQSLAIWRHTLGDTSRAAARAQNALGVHLARRGFTDEAEQLIQGALRMDSARVPFDANIVAQSHRNLGHALHRAGRYDEARAHYTSALALVRARFGEDNAEVGNGYINLGLAAEGIGAIDSARALMERGLAIRYRTLGREHDDIAADETHLARVLLAAGKLDTAESLLRHALQIERRGPPRSVNLAESLRTLGRVRYARGDRAEACALLREQRDMVTSTLGAYADRMVAEAVAAAAPCAAVPDVGVIR